MMMMMMMMMATACWNSLVTACSQVCNSLHVFMCVSDDPEDEEDWNESVKKCPHPIPYHDKYLEVTHPEIKEIIKQKLKAMFTEHGIYENVLQFRLNDEIEFLSKDIYLLSTENLENLPVHLRISLCQYSSVSCHGTQPTEMLIKDLEQRLQNALEKESTRMWRALEYLYKELDPVTEEILRKIDGVVRVQRKGNAKRQHGTGTGVLVRLNWSGTGFSPNTSDKEDFAILTNNHVIADDSEAAGSTVDFFYNAPANKGQRSSQLPQGVVRRQVTSLVTVSSRVPVGNNASEDQMDFSLLKFNAEYSNEERFTYERLKDCALYLNEIFENDLPSRPFIDFFESIPLISISHPHSSNKRISFDSLNLDEVNALCDNDSPRYDTKYDLATCKGSSGCPVLAIHINSRGQLKACLQFLHFKQNSGIVIRRVYEACKDREEIQEQYKMFSNPWNSDEGMSGIRLHAVWHDEEDCALLGLPTS